MIVYIDKKNDELIIAERNESGRFVYLYELHNDIYDDPDRVEWSGWSLTNCINSSQLVSAINKAGVCEILHNDEDDG